MIEQASAFNRHARTQHQEPIKSRAVWATVIIPIIQYSDLPKPVQRAHPVAGTFSTQDVRPWNAPRHQTSKYLPFAEDYSLPPNLFLGLNSLDFDCRANIRIKTNTSDIQVDGFRLAIDSWHDTVLYSARVGWLEIPPNEAAYQYGQFCTMDDHPWYSPQIYTSRRITFSRPFNQPPKVVVALHALDMNRERNWRVVARATDIDRHGFTIHLDTWHDSRLYMAKADWFAYPADQNGIVEGTLTAQDPNGNQRNHSGTVEFGAKLSKIPNVFVGINMLDVGCAANLRISAFADSITTASMTWHIDTWSNTILYGAGISYVCV